MLGRSIIAMLCMCLAALPALQPIAAATMTLLLPSINLQTCPVLCFVPATLLQATCQCQAMEGICLTQVLSQA